MTPQPQVVMPTGARADLGSLLQVLKTIDGVRALSIVADTGIPVASLGTENMDEGMIAAMTAALLSISGRASQEFNQGNLEMILTKATGGTTLIVDAGPHATMVMLLDETVDLAKLFTRDFAVIDRIRTIIKAIF